MRIETDNYIAGAEPIRVLHILEATAGGTMRYMENIAEASEGLNMLCGFAYGTSRADSKLLPFLEKIKGRGWQVFPVDMSREIEILRDIKAMMHLRRVIKAFSPDIVHCHSSKAGGLGRVAAALRFTKAVRLYSPHAIAAPLGSKYLKIEKLLSRMTEQFVAVSESERKQIIDLSLAKSKLVDVIYPSIDFSYFEPRTKDEARSVLGLGSNPTVIACGRLTAQKDPGAFISILKKLHTTRPDVRGIWVGSGEMQGELQTEFRRQIAQVGLQDVISVMPWVHDVRVYVSAADVVLSTSKFESFGYVTAEALAMQRPVVASNVTGTCDIMRNLREWLYTPGDLPGAASLLLRLIEDRRLADEVGMRGRQLMTNLFSTERMRESLRFTYMSALNSAGFRLLSHKMLAPLSVSRNDLAA